MATTSFAAAQPDFTDVNEFLSAPEFYGAFLGSHGMLPAESTVHIRMDTIVDRLKEQWKKSLWPQRQQYRSIAITDPGILSNGFVPVDMDAYPPVHFAG